MRERARAFSLRHRLRGVLTLLATLTVASGIGAAATAMVCYRGRVESEQFEEAARRTTHVGQLAREQYIHEAHTVLVGDRSHVEHHDAWVGRLREEIVQVRPLLSEEERADLEHVEEHSRDVAQIFADEIVPAISRGDQSAARAAHERADDRVHRMTEAADLLAAKLTVRAHAAESAAEQKSWVVTAFVLLAGVLASILGLAAARRLYRDVSRPLAELETVTRRVATGDRSARMSEPAVLELAPLATAFDAMLDALQNKEEALRAADRLAAIGRVAAGVAHEINNPIGVIRGYLKTLRRGAVDDRLAEDLATIDDEAGVCQRIVEDLLSYAHVPALSRMDVEADELAAQAVERCADRSDPANIHVDVERAVIQVDPLRIRQVLVNVVRNAIEASHGSVVEIRGRVTGGNGYTYRVLDRGPGFAPEARERLFEPFFTTRPDGTGLGLAVSYGLVTAHGGSLRAEPRESGGTEIVIELERVVSDVRGAA